MKFIKLTLNYSSFEHKEIYVNFNHVTSFYRSNNSQTIITTLNESEEILVKETLDDVIKFLGE